MALKKKTVVLNLAQLGNQKSDPKSLVPGSPTLVENAQFVKGNRIDKRFGYDSLNILQPLTYYVEYPGPSASSLDTDDRINMTFTGGGSLSVNLFVIFDNATDQSDTIAEWDAGKTAGFSLGIVDASGDLWVITTNGAQTFLGYADTDFWVIQSNLRNTGGTEKVTVQKNGFPATIDDLATFAPYDVNNIATYTTNNPSGWVKRYAAVGEELKNLVGTEDHLLLHADDKLFSYSETLDVFAEVGDYRPAEITIDSINEDNSSLRSTDCIHADGITYYASLQYFSDTAAFKAVIAVDEATGEHIFGPINPDDFGALGDSDAATIRLLLFNGVPYVFYSSTSGGVTGPILGRTLSSTGFGPETTLVLDLFHDTSAPANNFWHILNYNDTRLVLNYAVNTERIITRYFDEDLIQLAGPPSVLSTLLVPGQTKQISASMSSSGDHFFVFGSGNGTPDSMRYYVVNDAGTVTLGPLFVGLTVGGSQQNAGGICTVPTPETLDGAEGVRVYYNPYGVTYGNSADGFGRGTIRFHLTDGGTLTDPLAGYQGHGFEVISKGYLHDGNVYYLLYRSAVNDTCYYIGSWDGDRLIITAQFLYGRVPDGSSQYRPNMLNTNFTEISPGVARVSVLSKDLATSVPGMVSVKIDFTSGDLVSAIPYGRSMILAGTNLHSFCGEYLRELNFFHRSREPKLSTLGSTGYIPEGLYAVVLVYEFTDRNGYLHRSAPSAASTVTTGAGVVNAIECRVEQYSVTNLTSDDYSLVTLIPYRTSAGGSIFYRDEYFDISEDGTEPADPSNQSNFAFLETRTITMKRSDEELETQATLYTASGEIPPSPIPPVKYLDTWGSRIWAAGSARDEAIYFSKLNQTNLMPEFSELFSISVQDKPGRTTGIKGMTDKIILSKRGRLFFSYGEGPDNTGGGLFANFEEIPGVSGAISGRSMVVNGAGISYRSDKGVYTLTPGLETVFTGAPYEDAIDEEILEAITPIDSDTLRFITATGILSYNNFFNAWSKDSSASLVPIDATLYNNRFHVLTATQLLRENLTKWVDGIASYDIVLETGWISFADLAGFQRFYKLFMVMDNLTPYDVKVSLAYDYGDYESETTFSEVTDSRIIIYPSKQKCEAFRFKIEATGTSGTEESLKINFVSVEVGMKQGLPKQLPVAQRIGVTTI